MKNVKKEVVRFLERNPIYCGIIIGAESWVIRKVLGEFGIILFLVSCVFTTTWVDVNLHEEEYDITWFLFNLLQNLVHLGTFICNKRMGLEIHVSVSIGVFVFMILFKQLILKGLLKPRIN